MADDVGGWDGCMAYLTRGDDNQKSARCEAVEWAGMRSLRRGFGIHGVVCGREEKGCLRTLVVAMTRAANLKDEGERILCPGSKVVRVEMAVFRGWWGDRTELYKE
jgi:hypothetical protein